MGHGLFHGDGYTHVLFDYHMDDLAVAIADTDSPTIWRFTVPLLLYANGVALLSHSREGDRRALNVAYVAPERLGHLIEPLKCAVLVFPASLCASSPPFLSLVLVQGDAPLLLFLTLFTSGCASPFITLLLSLNPSGRISPCLSRAYAVIVGSCTLPHPTCVLGLSLTVRRCYLGAPCI